MNKIAAVIAVGAGGLFFALETIFPYNPVFTLVDKMTSAVFSTDHSKARAAVSKRLTNPSSAQFDGLRTVEAAKVKYVCGGVNSKDRAGAYTGRRAFVYDTVSDYALLDSDVSVGGDSRFRPCQTALKEASAPVVSIRTASTPEPAPKAEVSDQPSIFARLPVIAGAASPAAELRTVLPKAESEAAPASMQANLQALAQTTAVRTKWIDFRSGKSSSKPSTAESNEAIQAALAVDPQSKEGPQAWSSIVELRKNDLDATTQPAAQTYSDDYQEIYRRVSSSAKRCVATKAGPYASMAVEGALRADMGYGETTVTLISKDQRNFHLSARVDKVQSGAKLTVRSGNTLGGDNLSSAVIRWASGDERC